MSNEVDSLSTQAEKILDEHVVRTKAGNIDPREHHYGPIDAAAVLANLAIAHAIVQLAEAVADPRFRS